MESTPVPTPAPLPQPLVLAGEHMAGYPHDWYICGGWATDLLLGRQTRDHGDVDIAVFEDDQRDLFTHLHGWRLLGHDDAVADDCQDQWDGRRLTAPGHVHARTPSMRGTELDIQICRRSGDDWVLVTGAAEPAVTRPLRHCRADPRWGDLPVVSPVVVLYFKALMPRWRMEPRPAPRPQDEADVVSLLPMLDDHDRQWLARSIAATDAHHPWLARIWGRPG